MKAGQITAVFFCILVSSTLAHEYLRAKQYGAPSGRSKLISPFEEKISRTTGEICTFVCHHNGTIPSGGSIKLIINATAELVALFNVTAEVAIIFDIANSIVGLFNGTSGAAIFINITAQTGLYIAAGESSSTWLSSDECFSAYFASLSSLKMFFSLNVGTTFSINGASTAIVQIIGRLLAHLSSEISVLIQQDYRVGLKLLLQLGSAVIGLLNGTLKGILNFAGRAIIHLAGDLAWFVNVLQGIGLIIGSIEGGLAALIKAKIEFDLAVLFAAENGIELLINILLTLVSRLSLSVLSGLLSNTAAILEVIVKLGGNVAHGITGVFKVIWHLHLLLHNHIEIGAFIKVLVTFYASKKSSQSIELDIYLNGLINVLEIQNSTHGSSQALKEFSLFINSLKNGTLTIAGINVSSVIKLLVATGENILKSIVGVLLIVSSAVTIAASIPTLLFYLIHLLLSSEGTKILQHLIPDIKITVSSSNGNFLGSILGSVANILSLLLGGVIGLLTKLPVVSEIVTSLTVAVTKASKKPFSFTSLIHTSDGKKVFSEIESFLKVAINKKDSATISYKYSWSTSDYLGISYSYSVNTSSSSSSSSTTSTTKRSTTKHSIWTWW